MRTLPAQEQQVVKAPGYAARMRVKVEDGGGTMRDLTALTLAGGRDFTRSIRVEDNVDSDFATASVVLHRQLDRFWNISPHVETSKLNLVSGSYSPLLEDGRLFTVEAFLIPAEILPAAGDWHEIFRGRIIGILEGQDTIEVRAADLGHELADAGRFLEVERQYGSGGGVAVQTVMQQILNHAHGAPFVASASYTNRDRVVPTTPAGFWYQSESTAAAGAEPSWPTTVGNTVTSGSVTFRCMGTIPQLYTPSSPSWNIAPAYQQRRESCWTALQALVVQLGWSLRYKYDEGTSAWRLTFFEPDRSNTTPDFTWYPDTTSSGTAVPSILEIPSWESSKADIRNVLEGTYVDRADLDEAGKPKTKTVTVRDTTSIDSYGWRWMGIALKATDQIDTSAEMTTLLNNWLSDMKDPFATHEVVLPLFWAVELGDLYRFTANNYSYTSDQDLAVVAFVHEQGESGPATTRLACRGKPSGGFSRWRRYGFDVSALKPAPKNGPDQPTGVTVAKVQGGLAVTWAKPTSGPPVKEYEVHASASSGFTPGSSTLKAVTDATNKTIGDLTPGTTYYVKVVPRGLLEERGSASAEASTAAGYTPPRAMTPQTTYNELPFNQSFEAHTDTSVPPDTWSVASGTWNTNIVATTTSGEVYSGARAIKFTAANAKLRSQLFPVRREAEVQAAAHLAGDNASDVGYLAIEFYDAGGSLLSTTSLTWSSLGSYFRQIVMATPDATAAYAAIVVGAGGTVAAAVYVDNVRAVQVTQVDRFRTLTFNSGWGTSALGGGTGLSGAVTKDTGGRAHLRGVWDRSSGSNTTATTIPAGWRPRGSEWFDVWDATAGAMVTVEVKANGDVIFSSVNNSTDYKMSGISWEVGG